MQKVSGLTKGEPAVWWCTISQGSQEMLKRAGLLLIQLQDFLKYPPLHRSIVYPDRTAADFDAVQYQVVVLPADLRV